MISSRISLRARRVVVAAATVGAVVLGSVGLAPTPASAAPTTYLSAVEGFIAVKGAPAEFTGVTVTGTFDEDTGALTAQTVFPTITFEQENQPAPGTDVEVTLKVTQPNLATGSVVDGVATLDAQFSIVVTALTLIDQASGIRSPLPLGPTPDSCRFAPINVDLQGTAVPVSEGGPLRLSLSDPTFVIPPPPNQVTDCGGLGALLIPQIAGPAPGEDPNSAELAFTLNSAQAIVESLYQTVLGRSPEQAGLEYWAGQLEAGVSPTKIAISIGRSREGWRSAVIDSYRIALQRDPEPAGLRYWTDAMVRSQDQAYLIGYLFASAEADGLARDQFPDASANEAYVRYLYDVLLERTPSAGDLTFWVDRIERNANHNVSRKAAAEFFYKSPEIVRVLVRNASLEVCEVPASGTQEQILRDAYIASKYQTRILLAVATVTPCPATPV